LFYTVLDVFVSAVYSILSVAKSFVFSTGDFSNLSSSGYGSGSKVGLIGFSS